MKKLLFVFVSLVFVFLFTIGVSAVSEEKSAVLETPFSALTDGSEKASVTVKEPFVIRSEENLSSLYFVFYTEPVSFTITAEGEKKQVSAEFLRQYISLEAIFSSSQKEITIEFEKETKLLEIYGFSGEVPSWVQIWKPSCEKADLCLMTTHADDEQLFFAGVLPYYAGEKKMAVQVIYFTDHVGEPLRRHELLRGLWTVGVTHYPVIGPFPDLYSKEEALALRQLSDRGWAYEDIVSFQVEMLRRFRPLVVVGHDPLGEYGHGQHIVNSRTLQDAVLQAGKEDAFPESYEKYGAYEVPKTYLHLYKENPITLNWDEPLSAFDGKTAFEMTKLGFACHDSQQYTWFRRWLGGENGQITRSDQIRSYSPNLYGLFRSLVGEDVEKNDFFENQLTYEEMRILEEKEKEEKAAAEKARLEKERLEREERERKEAEAKRKEAQEKKEKKMLVCISASVFVFLVLVSFLIFFKKKRK